MTQTIQIGITRRCNLKCKFCELTDRRDNTVKDMTFFEFREIVDTITKGKEKTYLSFCAFGEPLLNDDIIKMLQYAKLKKCHVSLRTNGLLLNKGLVEALCDNHIDSIEISVTGINADIYKMYQGYGVDAETVLRRVTENLKYLVQYRNKSRGQTLVQTVCMKLPSKEQHNYLRVMAEIGVDIVVLQPYKVWHQKGGWKDKGWMPCEYLLGENYVVDCKGEVPICCAAIENLTVMGNVFDTSFLKIKRKLSHIRNANRNYQFDLLPEICQECHAVAFGSMKDFIMWQTFIIYFKNNKIDYIKTLLTNVKMIENVVILYWKAWYQKKNIKRSRGYKQNGK